MEIVTLIPGATTAGDDIDLPDETPDIESAVAATIERLPQCLADHGAAAIVAALNPHTGANVRDALADHLDTDILGAVADHSVALLGACFDPHTQAEVVNAILEHAVHAHGLQIGVAGAPADPFGAVAGATQHIVAAAAHLIPGGVAAQGIQDYTTPAHAVGVGPIVHGGAADLAHVADVTPVAHSGAGMTDMGHGASGTPVAHAAAAPTVVATTPDRVTARTFELGNDTLVGDTLTLFYIGVGEQVLAS